MKKITSILCILVSLFSCFMVYENLTLKRELQTMTSEYSAMEEKHDKLNTSYNVLQKKHNELQEEYNSISIKVDEYNDEIVELRRMVQESDDSSVSNVIKRITQSQDKKQSNSSSSSSSSSSSTSTSKSYSVPYKVNYHGAVYRTRTGKCYHYESPCGNGSYFKTTWDEVNDLGLQPCGKCVLN